MSTTAERGPDLESLRSELGTMLVEQSPPMELAGCRLRASVEPRNVEDLAESLRALGRAGASAIVRGGGTRIAQGNPARDATLLLSTHRLAGVDEVDADDGVVHAAAGTPLVEIARQAEAAGWVLPLDPPGDGATLGGTLASAAAGPRTLAYGPPRDAVLGLEVALATGERTRCGGRVVKNVTGYDLAKLYVGSMGTLGVIEGAWLRLRPRPHARLLQVAPLPADPERAFELALGAARRGTARAFAVVDASLAMRDERLAAQLESGNGWLLAGEFAGDPAACTADAEWLASRCALEPDDASLIDRLRALQGASLEDRGVHVRMHVLPSSLSAAAGALRAEGATLLVYPVPGVLHARIAAPDELHALAPDAPERAAWLADLLGRVEAVRRTHEGALFIEALPGWSCAAAHDVFGEPGPALELMRALKQQFDPGRVLNPGRFAGRL